jgi:hypothetical protein
MHARPAAAGWLFPALIPLGAGLAAAAGTAEHRLLAAEVTGFLRAMGATPAGSAPPAGGLLLAVAVAVADVAGLGLCLRAFTRGFGRYRQSAARFPWLALSGLVSLNVLCLTSAPALGAVTTWASALGLALAVMVGGDPEP